MRAARATAAVLLVLLVLAIGGCLVYGTGDEEPGERGDVFTETGG